MNIVQVIEWETNFPAYVDADKVIAILTTHNEERCILRFTDGGNLMVKGYIGEITEQLYSWIRRAK